MHDRATNELRTWFRIYKRALFCGSLPDASVRWTDRLGKTHVGWCAYSKVFDYGEILLSRRLRPFEVFARITLIHEMCHLKLMATVRNGLQTKHGPRFKHELLRHAKFMVNSGLL